MHLFARYTYIDISPQKINLPKGYGFVFILTLPSFIYF